MKKLFLYLKPYTNYIIFALIVVFMQAISELFLPTLMSNIVDIGIAKGDINYILKIGGIMLLVAAIGTVCATAASYLSSKTAMGFGRDLRYKVFETAQNFSLNEFNQMGSSTLITRTTNDITQIQQVIVIMLRMMITSPLMCIGGIIMAVSQDKTLSSIIIVVIPIMALVIALVAAKGMPLFKSMQAKLDRLNLVLRENLTGIRVIRAFNREDYEKKRFNKANKDLTDTTMKVFKLMAILMPSISLIMNFTTIAIIWFGGMRVSSGHMQIGSLMAFIQYVMQIMFSLIMFSMMFVIIPRASVSAARINEVIDMVPDIDDPLTPLGKDVNDKKGYVEFKDVTFSYPNAEKPVLSNISFFAKPGEVTAIIGGTGSGKSTLINLIPRFYDVKSGNVLINDIDVREMAQKDLRQKIGFVPQKAVLFTGTISDNIRYGKEDATMDEIEYAAKVAQATEFISGMEDGFESFISQGGTNVSGGQKQRISIARALVRKPEIYIFDDSFSALDFKTDAKLRKALKGEIKNATMIVVAQRVSTVMDADQIIVLDEGKIAGIGRHKELLKSCKIYREIVSSQLSEEELQ